MDPVQITLASFELLLLGAGAFLLVRIFNSPERRQAWFAADRIPTWPMTGHEVTLLVVLIFLCGFAGQSLSVWLLGGAIKHSVSKAGLEVMVYGGAFHGCALLGWPLFRALRGWLHADYGALPAAAAPAPRLAIGELLRTAATGLVASLPAIVLVSHGWELVLERLGLPAGPQDLVEIFAKAGSPLVIAGMLFVACVLAPVNEELLFRAGIFRFLRQRFGRVTGFAVSSVCFGALHGNWAGFLPLVLLGAALALVYEKTGDIRVSMALHALFNLNTVLIVLSGLPAT
ncbi:MAG: CPBP family intramembrane metalloprotease [Opitutae bacterium]|nr:CPBP family intramembrane metalloprotease [Opitutae bacterium]